MMRGSKRADVVGQIRLGGRAQPRISASPILTGLSLFDPKAGRLPIRERELIAVVVSSTNGCGLCEIHHTLALGNALGDETKARRIALAPSRAVDPPRAGARRLRP
jgi:AhpD family alkylhydroperoxidase